MKLLKTFVKKYFTYFSYFYSHLRYRLFVALVLSILVAILDGFGLAMFLPLLQISDNNGVVDPGSLGGLRFIVDGLQAMNIVLTLTSVLIVILIFFSLKGIAKFIQSYYKTIVRLYFVKRMLYENVNKLAKLQFKSFVNSDSGRIQNTITGEVGKVAQAYQYYLAAVQDLVMITVYVALALMSNPGFALLVTMGGLLSNYLYKKIYVKTKAASRKVTHHAHVFQGLLIQKVANFKYLKATGLIWSFTQRMRETIDKIEKNNTRMGYYASILTGAREPIVVLVVVAVILIQVTFFGEGIALIMLSLMFFYRSLTYVMNMQTSWNSFLSTSGSLENVAKFTEELTINQEKFGPTRFKKLSTSIELRQVSFSYGKQSVLNDVSLVIPKNQTFALVGESGSGKTTLVNVIAGLLPIETGAVLIDNQAMNTLHVPDWQHRIGYITQEPVIFSDSVYNNVTFWAPRTEENLHRFWQILEKAAIANFVRQLPDGDQAQLGIGGILISGGQKQRLSIARELFKDVDLLIMDEATSALDSETEQVIQENIESLKGQYTILIIAHRLATVKTADRIILMNNGSIVAEGSFEELLNQSASFNKMVSLQEL